MRERWEPFHDPAVRWVRRLQRTILRLGPPRQACFVSIANALEVQVEEGADPETFAHLLRAILSSARAEGVSATELGMMQDDVDDTLATIRPAPHRTR